MAKFLTTSGTSHYIENIIMEAETTLILVSPFLQISKTLLERLKDASNKGVQIKIIYGKDELRDSENKSLGELKNLKLYFLRNLHAKCYFNEKEMVITSMNMYHFSEKNNREMGILIDAIIDKEIYDSAVNEAHSIINHSKEEAVTQKEVIKNDVHKHFGLKEELIQTMGYCIRCEDWIDFSPNRPYCPKCFNSWAYYNNAEFIEKVCHRCGEKSSMISMNNPECSKCHKTHF